jgi:hypothetical protein
MTPCGYSVQGGDVTFKNYGVSDIEAGLGVLADTSNLGDQDNPPGIVLPTASGGQAKSLGVTVEKIRAGKSGRVRLLGSITCTAAGTVTYGEYVKISDTMSKLGWVATAGSAAEQIGQALGTSTDGTKVEIWLCKALNA